ncbi:glycosyltransferase [Candidatus Azambacteria bacterium]|nr:glycosyltransferase [Candidatus Azambacteria bacterium]
MYILLLVKYPPIQGGVSANCYWLAQALVELGHRVTVLTNAGEVEDECRINLSEEDLGFLNGFRIPNSIKVVSTKKDSEHYFIPQSNPYLSKLISLGLDIISADRPDFIWAYYIEPYGIAALTLSKLTGIPYVIQHAGSDLGRLGLTEQMKSIHQEVYRQALIVSTGQKHYPYFESIGVNKDNFARCGFRHLPGDLFYPIYSNSQTHGTKILVYGKTGSQKGTPQLIEAIKLLWNEEFDVHLTAYWGGRNLKNTTRQLLEANIRKECIDVHGFIPHWRIPEAIRESDAVVFLENNFNISFHTPGIPLEVLSCGRFLITTEEIAKKFPNLISIKNTIVIDGQSLESKAIARAIKLVPKMCPELNEKDFLNASIVYSQGMNNLERFLSIIQARL